MNAIDLLTRQHQEVTDLFEECHGLDDGDAERKLELFDEIADALAIHATIEEQHFYPAAKRADEDLVRESLEEHLSMKRIIADLLETEARAPEFDARLKVLEEQVQHHVEAEEGRLFPEVKKLLGSKRLEELGDAMEATAEALEQEGSPRERIPSETEAPAPLE